MSTSKRHQSAHGAIESRVSPTGQTYVGLKVNTKLECEGPEVFPCVDVAKQDHVVTRGLHELHQFVDAETVRNETL